MTRTFPIPGLAQHAIGLKHVEEAVAIRDRLMTAFDQAASLPPGAERRRLLTVTFVGGGFSGVEGFGELLSLATAMLKSYQELSSDELSFHLVEARGRILPEVGDKPGAWVVRSLERRGAHVHLNTQIRSLADGHVVLSNGEEFDSALVVWTAGNASNPVVHNHSDLPIDERGLLVVRPDLRVGTDSELVSMHGRPAMTRPFPTWLQRCRGLTRCRTPSTPYGRADASRRTSWPTCADGGSKTTATAVWGWWPRWGWDGASSSTRGSSSRGFLPG